MDCDKQNLDNRLKSYDELFQRGFEHCLKDVEEFVKMSFPESPITVGKIDRSQTVELVRQFYKEHSLDEPRVVFVRSIWQMAVINLFRATELSKLCKESSESFDVLLQTFNDDMQANCVESTIHQSSRNRYDDLEQFVPNEKYSTIEFRQFSRGKLRDGIRWIDLALCSYRDQYYDLIQISSLVNSLAEFDVWNLPMLNQRSRQLSTILSARLRNSDTYGSNMMFCDSSNFWMIAFYYFAERFESQLLPEEVFHKVSLTKKLNQSAFAYLFYSDLCIVCEKPVSVSLDDSNRLHSDTGPALEFSDGYTQYFRHGIPIPKDLIVNPQSFDASRIFAEKNAEIRRAFMEIYGLERLAAHSSASAIDSSKYGTLYQLGYDNGEPYLVLFVLNSTPEPNGQYKTYALRVPPDTRTAKQAVAWTFGLLEEEYEPGIET